MTTDVTESPVRVAAPPERSGPARPLPVPVIAGLAAGSGLALLLAFPPYSWWWLAPAAVAMLALAVHRRRLRTGAALGALAGLVFFPPLLSWSNIEVGYAPWLLLSVLEAGYLALLGAATAYLSPVIDRWRWTWPLLTAVAWVGQEALRSRVPFGGFPWGRLAFSQEDSPLLRLAALGGAPLVTFAVALIGGLIATAVWTLAHRWRHLAVRPVLTAGALTGAAGLVMLSGYAVPLSEPTGPPVTVALVQGNVPRLGLDFNAQRRAVLDNHVQATLGLAEEVAAGTRPQPDLVIWPENSSDIDPLRNRDAAEQIQAAATAIGVPILVGAGIHEPDGAYNVALVWDPVTGPGELYRKRHPVPFAEYLPLRPLVLPAARALVPGDEDIPLLGDSEGWGAGQDPGVLTVGPAVIGTVICFEVAYDSLVRDTVTGGGQLLSVQTNNATFNEAEARQQLAMVRLRAVEHGRSALMVSTVGISGFVDVDGRVSDATGFFTQDVRVRTLSLTQTRTLATVTGVWPELVLAGTGAAALVVAVLVRRRTRGSE